MRNPQKTPKAPDRMAGWVRAVRIVVFIAAAYLLVQLTQVQISIYRQRQVLEDLNLQCLDQKAENDSVERYLSMQDDTQLVEQIAREKLGFAYPDEVVFIDAAGS